MGKRCCSPLAVVRLADSFTSSDAHTPLQPVEQGADIHTQQLGDLRLDPRATRDGRRDVLISGFPELDIPEMENAREAGVYVQLFVTGESDRVHGFDLAAQRSGGNKNGTENG